MPTTILDNESYPDALRRRCLEEDMAALVEDIGADRVEKLIADGYCL